MNVNSFGAKNVYRWNQSSSSNEALSVGDILPYHRYEFIYDGSYFRMTPDYVEKRNFDNLSSIVSSNSDSINSLNNSVNEISSNLSAYIEDYSILDNGNSELENINKVYIPSNPNSEKTIIFRQKRDFSVHNNESLYQYSHKK